MSESIWRAPARATGWRIELLDRTDAFVEDITAYVTTGSLDWNAFRSIIGGGELSLAESLDRIDWISARIKTTFLMQPFTLGAARGTAQPIIEVPMGVWIPARYSPEMKEWGSTAQLVLLDKLAILDQDRLPSVYSLAAGANIVAAVRLLIQGAGELRHEIGTSSATLRQARAWEAGTARLTIINELLEAAGFTSLWVDNVGIFRAEPYVSPGDRPVVWDFSGSETSVTLPEYAEDFDMHAIPNRFVCVGNGSQDEVALIGVAENRDPNSPYSYQNRGRWVTEVEDGVDAATQQIIDELALRRLADSATPAVRMGLEHLPIAIPSGDTHIPLRVDNVVLSPNGVRSTIAELTIALEYNGKMNSTLRRFEGVIW